MGLAGAWTTAGTEAILMCVKPGGMYGEEKGQLKLSREKRKGGKGFERDGSEPAEISDQSGCVLGRTRGTTLCPASSPGQP